MKKRKTMTNTAKYIGIILGAFALNACNNQSMSSSGETTTPVWLSQVEKRSIQEISTTTGTAKAAKTVELSSEITGKYQLQINPKTKRPYKLGDVVEAGAVIIRLENKEHENSVQLKTKEMAVDIAEREWKGQKAVYEKGGVTEKDVLNAESSYINSQTDLENAHIELGKMEIKAPFRGVIVNLPYYTPDVEVASGEVMLGIMDYSNMYMEVELPENTIDKIKVGQQVKITNYNIESDTLRGEIAQLSPAINEETRTYSGFITIKNPELKLRPGMFAKGEIITTSKEGVLAVPKEIVTTRRGNKLVFTVESNNRAMQKHIETGISDDEYIEIVSGLEEGEKIVIRGYEWLNNRSRVKIMK